MGIKSFSSFNEEKKWIKDAIKHPGALKKSLGKEEGEKLTKKEIQEEIDKLKAKDKDKKKPGTQLDKKDATKKRRLELAKTLSSLKENHDGGVQNYMFFGNLKTIKRLVDEMLEMDEAEVDAMLTNGHNWALDHIATSKDDVEEVFNFLAGHADEHEEKHHEEKPLFGGPESSHTVHDNHMRNMASEEGQNIKGFGEFNEDFEYDDDEDIKPIGVDNMVEGTNGLVHIFTPLESDMVNDWNSDETIQKWVEEGKVFLQEAKHDEWSIWGVEGDKEVENYIKTHYSF